MALICWFYARARWGASGVCVIIFAGPRKWVSHAALLEAASPPGSPVGGVCAASGPRRFEGLFGCLPFHCPTAQRPEDKARSAATNRPGRPAQRGRTGRGKAHGRAAKRRRPQIHTREPGRKAPLARDASPAGVACWPPRARGARRAPRARSAAEHKMTGRARRARTRGATQTNGGAKSWHEGGGPRERRRTTTPTRREEAAGADPEEAAAQPGRRSQGRAPGGREQPRTEQRAKEPGRPRRASVQAARRTATRRAAMWRPAQRVADHNWPGAGGTAAQRAGGPRARIVTARTERGGAGGRIASCGPLTASESVFDGLGGVILHPPPSERL